MFSHTCQMLRSYTPKKSGKVYSASMEFIKKQSDLDKGIIDLMVSNLMLEDVMKTSLVRFMREPDWFTNMRASRWLAVWAKDEIPGAAEALKISKGKFSYNWMRTLEAEFEGLQGIGLDELTLIPQKWRRVREAVGLLPPGFSDMQLHIHYCTLKAAGKPVGMPDSKRQELVKKLEKLIDD